MGRPLRYIRSGKLVEITCRTMQSRLLLRPSPVAPWNLLTRCHPDQVPASSLLKRLEVDGVPFTVPVAAQFRV